MTDFAAELADRAALRDLAERYASGVDLRDADLYISAFLPDATLYVHDTKGDVTGTRVGHEELAKIPTLIKQYDKTFHFLGQSRYEINGDEATGEVYCMAHHLSPDRHGGTNFVMYMRYFDTYRRDETGTWKIATRHATSDWTDVRAAIPIPRH
jgi:ketosteroid isomerase-like protein